jgi:NADPH2:quinone reductase
MKAIRIHEIGGPEVLKYEDVPEPQPGAGEVRIQQEVAGVNFIDIYFRDGRYKAPLPAIVGQEGGGVIDALGEGVTDLKVGERVAYSAGSAAYAPYAVVRASNVVPVPDTVDLREAVAAMAQGLTAHYLALSTFPLKAGDVALINAAAGGVGALLVQIAKLRGARVIAITSNEEKAQVARECGADQVLGYENFEVETKRLNNGKGVDVVYDSVGKDTFERSLNCLRPRGYMVLYGQSSGRVPPQDPQILNQKGSLYLTRPTIAHYIQTREELLGRANDLFQWIQEGQIKVRIDKVFPLEQAADAHRYLEGRHTKGKLLLTP